MHGNVSETERPFVRYDACEVFGNKNELTSRVCQKETMKRTVLVCARLMSLS